MTREEAIRLLSGLMFKGKLKEALDMAIKTLEQEDVTWIVGNDNVQIAVRNMPVDMMQKINAIIGNLQEPTTKNDLGVDAVNREAVLDLIADYDLSMGQVVKGIHALPSVTPQEPKTGHWIGHREHCENLGVMPSGLGAYEWCSNCDCGIDVEEWQSNDYNYCPNCGAKMVEP